jgi:hypothetical protein
MKKLVIQGIRSKAFLPRAIQLFMWLYAKANHLPPIKCCNHWSVVLPDSLMEYEAIGKGVVRRPYSVESHEYVREWVLLLNDIAYEEVVNYLESSVGKGYEFSNFLFHILKVAGFRWLGIYNDKRFSCIELANRCIQMSGYRGFNKFDNPYETQVKLTKYFYNHIIKD